MFSSHCVNRQLGTKFIQGIQREKEKKRGGGELQFGSSDSFVFMTTVVGPLM